jgi:hypothetical protein
MMAEWMKWAIRGFFGFMGVLFVYATVVQYNDPDPVLWMATYGVAAACCLFEAAGRPLPTPLIGTMTAVTAAWSIGLATIVFGGGEVRQMFPDEEKTGMVIVDTEEGREMGGLAIVAVTMGALFAVHRARSRRSDA